jgi:hypothetical protein
MSDETPVRPLKNSWPAIFVAYCNGCPPEELAQVYEVGLPALLNRIGYEGWAKLRQGMPQSAAIAAEKPNESLFRLKRIQDNRQKNLEGWVKLREEAMKVIDDLCAGKLSTIQLFHNKGDVVEGEKPFTMAERVNLATYLRTIADGTYRALGDITACEKPGQDNLAGAGAGATPSITIILPGVISAPREQRGTQVIDIQSVSEQNSERASLDTIKERVREINTPPGEPKPSPESPGQQATGGAP